MFRGAFVIALGLVTGCSQWHWDLGNPLYTIPLPQPENRVTLGDALALYGPPLRMSATAGGYVLAWEHWHIRENSFGISLGVMGADFASADWGELRAKGEFVLLTFDRNHMLTASQHSSWDNDGGGGQAVQPFFSFVSVVDADDLLNALPQHRWGAGLMRRLPETLNSHSDPDEGQNGLEQRGTPSSIGQRSLEMR